MNKILSHSLAAVAGFFTGATFLATFRLFLILGLLSMPTYGVYKIISAFANTIEKRVEYNHEMEMRRMDIDLELAKQGVVRETGGTPNPK